MAQCVLLDVNLMFVKLEVCNVRIDFMANSWPILLVLIFLLHSNFKYHNLEIGASEQTSDCLVLNLTAWAIIHSIIEQIGCFSELLLSNDFLFPCVFSDFWPKMKENRFFQFSLRLTHDWNWSRISVYTKLNALNPFSIDSRGSGDRNIFILFM